MSNERGALLLALARASIREALGGAGFNVPDDPWLHEPGASFVTLMSAGELRGCIGTLEAHRTLADDVAHNARAAALRDTRFAPLVLAELKSVTIEVSLLSPPEVLSFNSDDDLYGALRPEIDGVILRYQTRGATFLPQVWLQLPTPREFVSQLQRKAGLEDVPLTRCVVQRYTVDKLREADFGTIDS